jgi:integrase
MPSLSVVQSQRDELSLLIDEFLAANQAAGRSPKTVRVAYGWTLRTILVPFARREGIGEVEQLTTAALNDLNNELRLAGNPFVAENLRKPLSAATVHSYMRAINGFLAWCRRSPDEEPGGRRHKLAGKGMTEVRARGALPDLGHRLVVVLEREDIQRVEDAAPTERDRVIIRALADTGVRVSELLGLHPHDLIEQGRETYLRVLGKGNKERLVPVPRGTFLRLRKYAERTRPRDAATDRLFVALRRSPRTGDYEPLTPSGVQQMMREAGGAAGIKVGVHPHLLRHSYATHALRRGMNPLQLQQILGHSDLSMIMNVYSHLNQSDAWKAAMAAFEPPAR